MPERSAPLARRFLALARRDPLAPALLGPDGEALVNRGDLAATAAGRATAWVSAIDSDRPVLLSLPNSPDLAASFVALGMLDVPIALADATAPADELVRCARAVGASAAVTRDDRLLPGEQAFRDGALAVTRMTGVEPVAVPPGTAVLKLTSGSTGRPRAVAASARQLVADAVQIMRTMGFGGSDVTLAAIPLTHSYGLGSCLLPLVTAGTPLAFPACPLPAALATTLDRARVAHFPAVPAMIRALANLPDLPELRHLRVCLTAGAALAPRDAAAFHAATGCKVHVFYGSSECGGITYDRGEAPVHAEGAVGRPLERVRVEIVDDRERPLSTGAEGRILVRSASAALGIVPASENAGCLSPGRFLTGDVGRLDEGGELILTGRVAEILNVAGKKVHPDEVRRVLESLPGVASAAVLGLPDPHRGDLVAAAVVPVAGCPLTVHILLRACRERLAPHKVPRRIVIVNELPVSDRGKLRRDDVVRLLQQVH
jgi:acyl-coenzyme A synthetase/AMP-(fatty) acid ligase